MNVGVLRTRDGTSWTPCYVEAIDHKLCIGCGRCFKVCGQGVLKMSGVDEDGALIDADDDEALRMVMTLDQKGKCIGCGACTRVCGKNAHRHATTGHA